MGEKNRTKKKKFVMQNGQPNSIERNKAIQMKWNENICAVLI